MSAIINQINKSISLDFILIEIERHQSCEVYDLHFGKVTLVSILSGKIRVVSKLSQKYSQEVIARTKTQENTYCLSYTST